METSQKKIRSRKPYAGKREWVGAWSSARKMEPIQKPETDLMRFISSHTELLVIGALTVCNLVSNPILPKGGTFIDTKTYYAR